MKFSHISIMTDECIGVLSPERGGIFVDCTAGGGGHSFAIAERLPEGSRIISIDRDSEAVKACSERLSTFSGKSTVVRSKFSEIEAVLDSLKIDKVDGVFWDLGVSSYQLDKASRGFSYMKDAPLDMRMDITGGRTAADVVNTYSEDELKRIIYEYGEEKYASRIAHEIVVRREINPFEGTCELAETIKNSIPSAARHREAQHPAKRTFQAIRIEVNGELDELRSSIKAAVKRLNRGGIAAAISFHSLEDRIVKQTFSNFARGCTCPPEFPVCVCGKHPKLRIITKKPILPTICEIEKNPRARSAKLRAAEKL